VVKTGLVTYKESLAFRKEVKEKGYAKNILMKLKTQSDQIHFIIINTIPISTKDKVYWLIVIVWLPIQKDTEVHNKYFQLSYNNLGGIKCLIKKLKVLC
jgi:hypothetical protein